MNSPLPLTAGAPAGFTRKASLAEKPCVSQRRRRLQTKHFTSFPASDQSRCVPTCVFVGDRSELQFFLLGSQFYWVSSPELSKVLKHEPERRSSSAQPEILGRWEGRRAGRSRTRHRGSCSLVWEWVLYSWNLWLFTFSLCWMQCKTLSERVKLAALLDELTTAKLNHVVKLRLIWITYKHGVCECVCVRAWTSMVRCLWSTGTLLDEWFSCRTNGVPIWGQSLSSGSTWFNYSWPLEYATNMAV